MINMRSQLERIVCGSSGSRRTTCGADRDSERVSGRERLDLLLIESHLCESLHIDFIKAKASAKGISI